jgi:hypothetical protein
MDSSFWWILLMLTIQRPGNSPPKKMREVKTQPTPSDAESFRASLNSLLVSATENGITVSNYSWKCVSQRMGLAWDVEITPVLDCQDT